jgi:hypothetical protein
MINGVLFRAIDTIYSVCKVETRGRFLEIVPRIDSDNRVANVNQRGTVECAVVHLGDKHEAAVVEIGVRDFGLEDGGQERGNIRVLARKRAFREL